MVFACGISSYPVGVFHLANHAFFKALLFLSAGSVIHAMADEQDMRKMGGLQKLLPFTYAMFVIGSLALMGFPFLTGFYSKDVILELAYAKYTVSSHFAHWLGTLSAFFTAFYSFRLLYLTFLSDPNGPKNVISHAHDAPIRMAFPLVVLAFGSIFIGYLTKDMIIGVGTQFWGAALFTLPSNMSLLEAEFIPHSIKLIPVIFSMTGATTAYLLYSFSTSQLYSFKVSLLGRRLYTFLNRKWFFDKIYHEFVSQGALSFGYHTTYKAIDRGIIEILGPYGISSSVQVQSKKMAKVQTGYLYHYAFMMLVGVTILITMIGLKDQLSTWLDFRLYPQFIVSLSILYYYSSKK
jgi:NADH-ubiquinone oxidoreductase chain 5